MNRRSILKFLGLAPLAAKVPAAANIGSMEAVAAASPVMPVTILLEIDGRKLAEAVSEALYDLN